MMNDRNEPTTVAPPSPMAILGSTIQALNEKNVALYSTANKAHEQLFGEYVFTPEPANETSPDSPGGIAELTREVERIIETIRQTAEVVESIANQT